MIIITGGSGGIGNSIIQELTVLDTVFCLYNNNIPENLSEDGSVKLGKLNISSESDVKNFVSQYKEILKNITLIHFATLSIDGLVMTYEFENWKKVMDININGNFLLTSNLLPYMIHDTWGRIIHISSVVGKNGLKGAAAYSTSKTALEGWSKTLSREYGRFNITSNILNLGYFEVGLIETLSKQDKENIIDNIPSRRLGKTSNIVNAIDFLINSDYVNGALIDIHGGI